MVRLESKDSPPISVVMPVRDGAVFLQSAVESILGQEFGDFEFLIVDDGSRDATATMLDAFRARDRRIKIFRTDASGIVPALNLGVSQAAGKYIARMDADDVALPGRFGAQLTEMERSPHLLALGSAAIEIDASGNEVGTISVPLAPDDLRLRMAHESPMLHPTVMIRRKALLDGGGYRKAMSYAEDYDLWLRLARQGDLANLAEPLLKLRRHDMQISGVRRMEQRAAFALARQAAAHELDGIDYSVTLNEALRLHLIGRIADPDPIDRTDGVDLAVMLRAAARAHILTKREVGAFCRRLAADKALPGAWLLPIKIWLGT